MSAQLHAAPVFLPPAQTAPHVFSRERSGYGPGDSETAVCSCGWKGRPVGNWNDWQSTTLREHEQKHLREVKGL